ncbi:GNAT family N-acetyltransferase [Vibrio agarivorans]|uniref:GNAT family N-acetyltransferase n=1 Tax=Vibrio agarivorans TaxID=153622 RepID=UPI0025B5112E|nr:GNAT family N-acetyltransferase [Vibrio agarivorans]MDN3663285.1 GNAT family N-acetyltransferase [Vibrio agarivorans]
MLVNDKENREYQITLEGPYVALAKYSLDSNVMTIHSTRVPDEVQGKGYGKVMMEAILPDVEQHGYKVIPACSYVAHYINRHPQWQHLLAE